jgi:hypothetical protein
MNQTPMPEVRPPAKAERSSLALASLVLGISGLVLCVIGPLLGIAAVICGHKARAEIRNSGGHLAGTRLATWGLATGYLSMVLIFVVILGTAYLAPRIMAHQQVSAKKKCIENLELIQGYKEKWALDHNRPGNSMPRDQELFGPGRYLEQKPVCPGRGVYILNSTQDPPYCTAHGTIRW